MMGGVIIQEAQPRDIVVEIGQMGSWKAGWRGDGDREGMGAGVISSMAWFVR